MDKFLIIVANEQYKIRIADILRARLSAAYFISVCDEGVMIERGMPVLRLVA